MEPFELTVAKARADVHAVADQARSARSGDGLGWDAIVVRTHPNGYRSVAVYPPDDLHVTTLEISAGPARIDYGPGPGVVAALVPSGVEGLKVYFEADGLPGERDLTLAPLEG